MTEEHILEQFLCSFATHAERRRRSPNNNILHVHRAIEQVFLQFSNSRVSFDSLRGSLLKLGYNNSVGSNVGIGNNFSNEHFFIAPDILEDFRRAVKTLPENTNESVRLRNEELKKALRTFFNNHHRRTEG